MSGIGVVAIVGAAISAAAGQGGLPELAAPDTGAAVAAWAPDRAPWYFTLLSQYDPVDPGPVREATEERLSDGAVRRVFTYAREEAPAVEGVLAVTEDADGSGVTLELTVTNRGEAEIDVVGLPGGLTAARGADRFLVHPLESGVLVPLDERFDRIRIYGNLPFVTGYPSNRASMQWCGVQTGEGAVMLRSLDRFGMLKRIGAEPEGDRVRFVFEHQVALRPGETVALPPCRIEPLSAEGAPAYARMAALYRGWVQERMTEDGMAVVDASGPVPRVPLQFAPFSQKRAARPHADRLRNTHGHPEHALRPDPTTREPFAYLAYGAVLELMRGFEEVYGVKVTPQLWSFTHADEIHGSWPLFPIDALAEGDVTHHGVTFAGATLGELLRGLRANDDLLLLYTNPTFWSYLSPTFNEREMYDRTGAGDIVVGGYAAQASEDLAYVSPRAVREAQVAQLGQLAGYEGDPEARALGIMFDSSQAMGGTLFNDSCLRRDAQGSCIDRNPNAQYLERYGYVGRDSYVQDRIQRDLALHAATPNASKTGEWVNEWTSIYMDLNAGSIDLVREYPDGTPRPAEDNVIPVPLYQMVFGDSQIFTIRVAAACDYGIGELSPETSRRSTALFGGVHQVALWGGVPWAGPAYHRLHARTYLITRDDVARRELFARRAGFRMRDAQGRPTAGLFSVRETTWFDDAGGALGMHWDNNTGETAALALDDAPLGRVAFSGLWGEMRALEQSLDRLRAGATATLLADGRFVFWDFSGAATWGPYRVEVTDSEADPAGLTVIWDGERVSLGNAARRARTVTVSMPWDDDRPAPAAVAPIEVAGPDGAVTKITYQDVENASVRVASGRLEITVELPGASVAGLAQYAGVPTTLATFTTAE